ncbi:cation:proton antiporter domain-containing protein [Fodinicurvata halophila]|uniref:cation:proton antiporter domain-containing protein n=1 Tax=Fodinicurvata halophila TaxID=1419723 RepID=UPI003626D794
MADAGIAQTIGPAVVLLGSAVIAVPLFRKLGLGSVLGYFAGGLLVGPSILGIFTHPDTILHISELGVVMFLFLIGLEMRPHKLWALRAQIFGLGLAQVVVCTALLTGAGMVLGLPPVIAFIAGAGFVLSSTAVIMSVLQERGELASRQGQQGCRSCCWRIS